jgi:hypothetical protein
MSCICRVTVPDFIIVRKPPVDLGIPGLVAACRSRNTRWRLQFRAGDWPVNGFDAQFVLRTVDDVLRVIADWMLMNGAGVNSLRYDEENVLSRTSAT